MAMEGDTVHWVTIVRSRLNNWLPGYGFSLRKRAELLRMDIEGGMENREEVGKLSRGDKNHPLFFVNSCGAVMS